MRKSLTLALAFATFAGLAGSAYAANDAPRKNDGPRARGGAQFQRADTDNSGDISFEEFAAAMNSRMGFADGDSDGKLTVEEIATEMQRMRDLRRAKRMVSRFDTNGDNELTLDEIESQQRKLFALMDRNDDGLVAKDEMPRRHMGGGRHDRQMRGGRHHRPRN